MKKIVFICIIIIIFVIDKDKAFAGNLDIDIESEIDGQLNQFDFSELENAVNNSGSMGDIRITDMITKAIKGELGLQPGEIISQILKILFSEISELFYLLRSIIIIAIISALFTNLSSAFIDNKAAELGFYVNYIIVVALLLSSFNVCVGIMTDFVGGICLIMEALIPIMATSAALSGSGVKAYMLSPTLLAATGFVITAVNNFIAPAVTAAAALQIVNHLTDREILQKLSDLIKKIISWGMKITAGLFMTLMSIQGLSAPILNNAAAKTAKYAVSAIPVVGAAFSGAVDTVFYWTGAVKSGLMVAALIVLLLACAVPLIKITAYILAYKVVASVIQPICDPRIVKVIDSAGSYSALMLSASAIVSVMFIFIIMIMLG